MTGTGRYIAWRVASMLVTVFIGAAAVFFAMKAAPGDPALSVLGESATPEAVAEFRSRHNLDAPLPLQFWTWRGGAPGRFRPLSHRGRRAPDLRSHLTAASEHR